MSTYLPSISPTRPAHPSLLIMCKLVTPSTTCRALMQHPATTLTCNPRPTERTNVLLQQYNRASCQHKWFRPHWCPRFNSEKHHASPKAANTRCLQTRQHTSENAITLPRSIIAL